MPAPESHRQFQRAVLWRNLNFPGSDYCRLWQTPEGWLLEGTASAALDDHHPLLATYQIHCDSQWRTHRVEVERIVGNDIGKLSLLVETAGVWQSAGKTVAAVQGCIDVDLAITPATNALPIRRLKLTIGQSADVTAAWIKFPQLDIQPLPQRYTRLADRRYRYESTTGFVTEVEVDDLGLAINYKGGWERIATT
jgi:uncharacterized protein